MVRQVELLGGQIDSLSGRIDRLDQGIEELITDIPAVRAPAESDQTVDGADGPPRYLAAADRLDAIAEIGLGMGVFATSAHLCRPAKISPRTIKSVARALASGYHRQGQPESQGGAR